MASFTLWPPWPRRHRRRRHKINPIDRAIAEFAAAHNAGRFDEAAAKRERARGLLDSMPASSPDFPGWVQSVAVAYADFDMTARARSVAEHALERTAALGLSHPNRMALLGMMADSWQEDHNLLKAVAYQEQAVAAQESVKPERPAGLSAAYQQLADLYRGLGRSDAIGAIVAKIRALPNTRGNLPVAAARFFERHGLIQDAIAVYRQYLDRAASAHDRASAFEALASLYQRRQQFSDAVETLQRAVAAADTEDLASLYQSLAVALQRAGRTADADRVYHDLLRAAPGLDSLTSYAAHLDATDRGVQAVGLLKQYQATHPVLDASDADILQNGLANAAVASGAQGPGDRSVFSDIDVLEAVESKFQKANTAAETGNTDEAFSLTLQAIEESSTTVDLTWMVSTIASRFASKKEIDKAEQLYQRLCAFVESQSRDTLTPLLDVKREYAKFLISQPERWSGVTDAIARYRDLMTEAHGAESGILEDVIGMTIEFETVRESPRAALAAAQELLSLQESLNGNTSEPYLRAITRVAGVYEMNGDPARALGLHRQAVSIADLVYTAADTRRGTARIEAAFALARQEQFDEAERLAGEAVAIGQAARAASGEFFSWQLEQIRDMRLAQDLY